MKKNKKFVFCTFSQERSLLYRFFFCFQIFALLEAIIFFFYNKGESSSIEIQTRRTFLEELDDLLEDKDEIVRVLYLLAASNLVKNSQKWAF